MGNLCGKVDRDDDPFAQPGRTLGSRPAATAGDAAGQPKTAAVPARVGGPPRTLGGTSAGGGSSSAADDARARAAAAAEARNSPKTGKAATGKLGAQLEAQRRETRSETLKKASAAEVRRREMDAAAEAAAHN